MRLPSRSLQDISNMIGTYMERHGVGFARAGNLGDPADQIRSDPISPSVIPWEHIWTHDEHMVSARMKESENDENVKDV